jgi:acyl carrier protein
MDISDVKAKLKTYICKEILNDPGYPLTDEEPLITSGLMDSFSLAQIGVFAEVQFNVYIPDADLTVDAMNTVNQMAARITRDL